MSITNFAESNEAAMNAWAADRASLDEALRAKFTAVITSPIAPEAASHFPEFVYAHIELFSLASKKAAADVCDFATSMGFYGLGVDQRGAKIAAILRGGSKKDGPVPLAHFKETPVAAVVPDPAPTPSTPAE